ncbi:hypothetical protein ACQP25_44825 (plasmid) [Microtetraspora malaysiensis]|uniref:hypothetical protein n=1 Tax=Microtetraspora malaysiensis TaxID=161358 RepID=UPI003D8B9FB2
MDVTGLSRASVARWIAWLHAAGLLGTVEHGTTPRFRGIADDGLGNRAAEYVLCTPVPEHVEGTGTPSEFSPLGENSRPSRARAGAHAGARIVDGSLWPMAVTPATKRSRLLAAEEMCQRSLDLRKLSAAYVRHLVAPLWDAGWTPNDVLYALDHRPDGTLWPYAGSARHVPGWVRFRLAPWHAADGRPALSRSQMSARRRSTVRKDQETAEHARQDARARRVDAGQGYGSRARAILAAKSPSAAAKMRTMATFAERSRWLPATG